MEGAIVKLLEHYTSVQGEGPNVGELTQFVRFAGCNLRCPGWPCDTQFAIEPSLYRGQYKTVDVEELVQDCVDEKGRNGASRLCLTGGEPLMQTDLADFVNQLHLEGMFRVDLFTNGTQAIPVAFDWSGATVVMDWKLPGSGEVLHIIEAGWDQTRLNNAKALAKKDAIKYVVKDRDDFESALRTSDMLHNAGLRAQEFVGAVWGEMREAAIVHLMQHYKVPWKLNVQMHNHIWPVNERRR